MAEDGPEEAIHRLDHLKGLGVGLCPRQAENAGALSSRVILGWHCAGRLEPWIL